MAAVLFRLHFISFFLLVLVLLLLITNPDNDDDGDEVDDLEEHPSSKHGREVVVYMSTPPPPSQSKVCKWFVCVCSVLLLSFIEVSFVYENKINIYDPPLLLLPVGDSSNGMR